MKNIVSTIFVSALIIILFQNAFAVSYADQHYIISGADSLLRDAEAINNIEISSDGKSLQLPDSVLSGYIILRPQHSTEPFNRGLPSWNGTAPDQQSAFKIQMRFKYGNVWSGWLTAGYWKNNIWSSYGATSFSDGYIDVDYVKMNTYKSDWQFKIILERQSTNYPSPTIHMVSFFVSDTRTTDQINYVNLLNDKPAQITIPTTHLHQSSLDPVIGGSICSPTSVSMILISYGIDVEPVPFARATYDPYHDLFGVWPRVVQNASEYGVTGYVTQYRSWSQAREVLANGGRIAMSVGRPLYSGHLMMLAGFDEDGDPLVHDPARSDGYFYEFDKADLDTSWFKKGGISYTFYLNDSTATAIENEENPLIQAQSFRLIRNYPNPFNNSTTIVFNVEKPAFVNISIYNINGQKVCTLYNQNLNAGNYSTIWNGTDSGGNSVSSGIYFAVYRNESGQIHFSPMQLVK